MLYIYIISSDYISSDSKNLPDIGIYTYVTYYTVVIIYYTRLCVCVRASYSQGYHYKENYIIWITEISLYGDILK